MCSLGNRNLPPLRNLGFFSIECFAIKAGPGFTHEQWFYCRLVTAMFAASEVPKDCCGYMHRSWPNCNGWSCREWLALNVYIALCYCNLDYYDVSLEVLDEYLQVSINQVIDHFKNVVSLSYRETFSSSTSTILELLLFLNSQIAIFFSGVQSSQIWLVFLIVKLNACMVQTGDESQCTSETQIVVNMMSTSACFTGQL